MLHTISFNIIHHVVSNIQLRKWCTEAGENVELVFPRKNTFVDATKTDASNPFWVALKTTLEDEL